MDLDHPIFNRPTKVKISWTEVETPANYRSYPEGKALPERMKVWAVHGKLLAKDYGLVSDGYDFGDSPDAEFISGGINSKGPSALALGRQGNWFLWGFCAPPEEMTSEARQVFLNTLVYMKGFAGQKALIQKTHRSRAWAFVLARYLGDDRLKAYGLKKFSAELLAQAEGDPAKLRKLLTADRGLLVMDEDKRWKVDEEVRAFASSNRDPAFLDACIAALDDPKRGGQAQKLLERYTGRSEATSSEWKAWFDSVRDRLYFSDAGGFQFRVAPKGRIKGGAPRPAEERPAGARGRK